VTGTVITHDRSGHHPRPERSSRTTGVVIIRDQNGLHAWLEWVITSRTGMVITRHWGAVTTPNWTDHHARPE
jgi:hypothetical protein